VFYFVISLISVHSPVAKEKNSHCLQVCRHTVVAGRITVVISSDSSGHVTAVTSAAVQVSWNVMAHAQKPVFVFQRNGRVHLNRRGRQFSRLLAAEVCASAVVILDAPCSEVVWRVLATHSIRQFSIHFPSRASPCAITFQQSLLNYPTVRESFSSAAHYLCLSCRSLSVTLRLRENIPLRCHSVTAYSS